MIEATAAVPTYNADRYVLSVCKRWHEGMDVNVRERQGVIHFENAVATFTPSANQLVVSILAKDEESIAHLQHVVMAHLETAVLPNEPLTFDWRRSANFELHAL
ncbi:MAG TPA: DUF2218 domain-containing protein [Sphingomicrobium sp.]|nr:DUF2218 domain-containing protein [Sphingomicrobium sp.]